MSPPPNTEDSFPRPIATVDLAIFCIYEDQLNVLLTPRANPPFQHTLALPGGFVRPEEDQDLTQAAGRILQSKTSVSLDGAVLEQVETVGSAERDPRGWSLTVLYMALVSSKIVTKDSTDCWIPVPEASSLAFDHQHLLERARDRLTGKMLYSAIPLGLVPVPFTMRELRHAYEVLVGTMLDARAFTRRMTDAGILKPTGKSTQRDSRRPAALFEPRPGAAQHVFVRPLDVRQN